MLDLERQRIDIDEFDCAKTQDRNCVDPKAIPSGKRLDRRLCSRNEYMRHESLLMDYPPYNKSQRQCDICYCGERIQYANEVAMIEEIQFPLPKAR